VSSTPIQQAKARLPLPLLMEQLGLGEHAKQNARCPFHDDRNPSFSIFQIGSAWFFKCHAGCGTGDEISFLEKHHGITRSEAIELYLEMAGFARLPRSFWRKPSGVETESPGSFDWMACVESLTDNDLERLGNQRWYSRAFCAWLRDNRFVGVYNDCIAFPVNDHAGQVVGAHYRVKNGSWRYTPGATATPLVIGELIEGDNVHLFESQFDAFAFIDISGETGGILITRGASNGGSAASRIPEGARVFLWTQNDQAGEKWQADICEHAKTVKATVKRVGIPVSHKDLNDWTRAGATDQDLIAALVKAETLYAPVNARALADLLDSAAEILRRYVVFQFPEQAEVCALWAIHTWPFSAFDYTPYLSVFAAEKRSGKSRLLEVLSLLVRNARLTSGSSSAALIRSVDEDDPPTILLDEVDAVYNKKNDAEAENTRQFLNAGFRRGAEFLRCVGQGVAIEVKGFPAFCPKALSGIGRCLPDTVRDRSLPVELVRQSREERAERFREREAQAKVATICAELETWVQQRGLINTLRDARPALPEELTDRQQDYCEPLLAIADLAGGEWPAKARAGVIKLCSQEEDASIGVRLLAAIRGIFDAAETDKLTTKDILEALIAIEDGPWALMFEDHLKQNKLQSAAAKLAHLLRDYKRLDGEKIKPRPIRLAGEIVKGFYRSDFEEVWKRYLQPSRPTAKNHFTSVTSVTYEGQNVTPLSNVTPEAVTNSTRSPFPETGVSLVTRQSVTDVTDVTPF
jgi:hypothetical protein